MFTIKTIFLLALICPSQASQSLWDLANENKGLLRISTLFTAQNVRAYLSSDEGIDNAIDWCKKTGVTHVFIETYRGRYTAERKVLQHAKSRFTTAGFDVSGCVTTTKIGKISTNIFDEIMIDDFLFTDCECDECKKARGNKTWADYRCELMTKVNQERILKAARAVNPDVKIIIKYPQWYDNFHNRGYEVVQQSADFDKIWVGTETRDYDNARWGRKVQYEAYYIMRWLGGIGGQKTGGGWFDPYGTSENTYVEQSRQTVLADAKEMLLFCYGSLLRETGPANVEKLRKEIPGLFKLAELLRNEPIKGVHAPKPPNSDADGEMYVFDFVGMLGLPLVPAAEINPDAKAAFLPVHALKDPLFSDKLNKMLGAKKPVLITDGLAKKIKGVNLKDENLTVLKVNGNPHSLLKLTRDELKSIRDKMLAPFGIRFDAPNKVAFYLIGDNCLVVENFNDGPVDASLEFSNVVKARKTLVLPVDGNVELSCTAKKINLKKITSRTLIAVEYSLQSTGKP